MSLMTDEQLQHAYRYAMSLSNDHASSMDIVHSAYLRLLDQDVKKINNLLGYFLRCVRNTFIDQKRLDDRWINTDEDDADSTVDIGLQTLEALMIEQDLIEKIWGALKPIERELLYLWALEGYTIDEISELTSTSRGTLLSRIHRVRKKIKLMTNTVNNEVIREYTA